MKSSIPLLEVNDLCKHYPIKKGLFAQTKGYVYAVDGVSFTIGEGETLGLVGESGCGKSTVGRSVLKLIEPTSGQVNWRGRRIDDLSRQGMRPFRRELQAVFQDPYSSLNPRMRAADIVAEPLRNYERLTAKEGRQKVASLFDRVGLRPDQMLRYPHEFSGGQRQRLGIARALAVNPKLIMCDEPVSALDVSVQAQVINLLIDLQKEFDLSYLFVAHDLAVVRHISHRVAVMYLGRIVELAPTLALYDAPKHPYTEALLSAVPIPDPTYERKQIVLAGDVPSPINRPSGCHFHTRCLYAQAKCREQAPPLQTIAKDHVVACHFPLNMSKPSNLTKLDT